MTFREHKKKSCQHIYMYKSQFVTIGPAKFLKIDQEILSLILFMAKIILIGFSQLRTMEII